MIKKTTFLLVLFAASLILISCSNKKAPETPVSLPQPAKGFQSVYFDFDQSLIRADQVASLESNADILKTEQGTSITVEGHCDERGTNEYNMALGDRRARAAKDYLTNLGIGPGRLNTVSYGEERPVCTGHGEECWWQNRRGDFVR